MFTCDGVSVSVSASASLSASASASAGGCVHTFMQVGWHRVRLRMMLQHDADVLAHNTDGDDGILPSSKLALLPLALTCMHGHIISACC